MGWRPRRILEIGPKDGLDSKRLLSLNPEVLVLLDQKGRALPVLDDPRVTFRYGDFLDYDYEPYPYDVIWCTGVLYHVKEQYRMIRKLYDLLMPLGTLVLESATIRDPWLRNKNVVQILYPPSERVKQRWHLSLNVTHLPSRRAIESWLQMVGFTRIERSDCHLRTSRALARDRAAYLATKP